jgi:formylglycine-generating enzyme required for sulfatase activity
MRSGWGKRLPVFALRTGRSKQGIYNLVGNVCEWVTPFEVRGGGWQDDGAQAAEGGFRFGVQQTADGAFRRNDVGFRYVAPQEVGFRYAAPQ